MAWALLCTVLIISGCRDNNISDSGQGLTRISQQKELAVAFDPDGVTLGQKTVQLPCDLTELVSALGEPSRTEHMANTIFVWDNLGIYAMAKPRTTRVHNISVTFAETEYRYWPKVLRTDFVNVAEHVVGPQTKISALHQVGLRQDQRLPLYWDMRLGDLLLSLETDEQVRRIVSLGLEGDANKAEPALPADADKLRR